MNRLSMEFPDPEKSTTYEFHTTRRMLSFMFGWIALLAIGAALIVAAFLPVDTQLKAARLDRQESVSSYRSAHTEAARNAAEAVRHGD